MDAGWRGCLAIDAQGRLWSVGEYMLDEPGSEPRLVADHVTDVSAGLNHFVFLTADGDVYVCGRNTGYPVAVDETTQYTPPVRVMGGAKAVAAQDDGSFVLLENGDLLFCGTFMEFSTSEPVLVGQGFDDLPFGAWAVKGNDLYAVRETETPTGWTLTPEKRLTGVAAVYAGVVRMANGRFLALDTTDAETPAFRELVKQYRYAVLLAVLFLWALCGCGGRGPCRSGPPFGVGLRRQGPSPGRGLRRFLSDPVRRAGRPDHPLRRRRL